MAAGPTGRWREGIYFLKFGKFTDFSIEFLEAKIQPAGPHVPHRGPVRLWFAFKKAMRTKM